MRIVLVAALVAAVGSFTPAAFAQEPRPAGPRAGAGRPVVTAMRAAQAPAIDGRLDDAIWRTAPLLDAFVQEEPVEGAAATEQTEVRVAYDNEKVYFGIYAHYSDVTQRRVNRSDRDKLDNDDTVTITLEPFLDYLRGYSFSVNGYGVQNDSMIVVQNAQSTAGGDRNYNALYYSGGQLTDDGWTAEIAIPIRSLRYPSRKAGEAHRWGFQVRRVVKSKDEFDVWSPVSRNDPNFLGQIGTLTGMSDFSTQRNFELLPTFTASSQGRLDPSTGEYTTVNGSDAGIGLKYGISSNLTFDFTYNPDFSQVESETQQIDINQRFPLNFAELRPFFLEGREIYEIAGRPQAVQTRRIVDPRYGAKLTGKVGSKTSIGLFLADDEAPGKVDPLDAAYGQKAQNVLGRVKYDLYRNSHVGMIFTDREIVNSSGPMRDDYSRLLGTDLALRMGETGNFGYRFYKSDREELGVRKTGWATEMSIRQNGRHFSWASIQNALSPNFGNQLSFIERVDAIAWMPQVGYQWFPEDWIRTWGLELQPPEVMEFRRRPAERHPLQSQRQLHVREEHQGHRRLQSLDGTIPRRRIREVAVVDVGHRQHEPESPVLGRHQQRRSDSIHRQSVSRAPARLRHHGDAPAVFAPAVGAEARRKQVHRSRSTTRRSST